ncbi:class I SAM-dependent methyltransferase [Massilimicrobiota sp. SW1139]|uniref:class I SAM-dependent methyltransferase n=1 Tax=Massilimicrobiota sp. SW1139 TaxID=2530043 RepID=UPI00143B4A37|nr:class I SAM-dependent methyltransferase [Massilimicrobiota sp. SW1139]NJE44860.1 class I SAM-dependent methyltransferase [Massilimicrobiota sp. SW1139]
MTHYYTNNIDLKSQKTQISFQYRGHHLVFISDSGVFSKERIDYGSRVLLESMNIQSHQKTLLDVGCGYGTLGISLKKVYLWLHVEMVDVNERAIALANESIEYNQENDIIAYKSSVYENVKDTFDIIVSNPPIRAGKKVVFEILEKAYDHLNNQGELFIVIQKKQGAPSAKKKMEDVFGNCEIIKRDKGYFILKSVK